MGVYFTVSSQNQPLTNDFMSTLNPYVLTARFLVSHLNSTVYLPSSMSQTSSYTHTAAYSERLPMSTEERPAPRGGRGGQRGRGRGRSRGRGNAHPTTMSEQHSLHTGDNQASVNTTIRRQPARPRPTHCQFVTYTTLRIYRVLIHFTQLSFSYLPTYSANFSPSFFQVLTHLQGHHPELRARVAAFQNALLHNEPKVPGLDSKILISPRRMHITLGVMNLIDYSQAITPRAYVTSSRVPLASHQTEAAPEAKTVQAAVQLLQALRPSIIEKLAGHDLLVGLDQMDIMRPDRGDLAKAHVMWAGPSYEGIRAQRLKRVCGTQLFFDNFFPISIDVFRVYS